MKSFGLLLSNSPDRIETEIHLDLQGIVGHEGIQSLHNPYITYSLIPS